jgi:hypothetical protein
MGLQVMLWSIPVLSLTIAIVLIAIRTNQITRDSLMKRACLTWTANEVLRSVGSDLRLADSSMTRPAGLKTRPRFSGAPAPQPLVLRKRVIPIVFGKAGDSKAAMAG